jgi:hypothetical protein
MRTELLSWFEREGLLLTSATMVADDSIGVGQAQDQSLQALAQDEVKIIVRAPLLALSRAGRDFRECPDPVLFGYPDEALDMMILDDMHQFVLAWFEKAVEAGMARCFVCNRMLDMSGEKPWDAVFIRHDMYCWLLAHFDCKRYLDRDLKGRNPFEVIVSPPEFFDMRVHS